jgi:uncharacterized paraquat-inducible protein A
MAQRFQQAKRCAHCKKTIRQKNKSGLCYQCLKKRYQNKYRKNESSIIHKNK